MEYKAGNHGQEKEWQAHNARFPPDCHVADDLLSLFTDAAASGEDVDRSTATSLVDKLMKWCGCSDGLWNGLLSGKFRFS